MGDSRITAIRLKRPTPSELDVNGTKRQKRESDLGHDSRGLSSSIIEVSSDHGECHVQESASAKALNMIPSVNWNLGGRAKIRTSLGGGQRKVLQPATERVITAESGSRVSDTGSAGPRPTVLKHAPMSVESNLSELPTNTANNTGPLTTQIQASNLKISKLGVLLDSHTRQLVQEGTSITIAEDVKLITESRNPEKKQGMKKTAADKLASRNIRSCLEAFVQRVGNEGLIEIINTSFIIARYATAEQAARAIDALTLNDCIHEGVTVLKTIKTFEQSTQTAKKFASMKKYYPKPITSCLAQGLYGDIIRYLQNKSPMSFQYSLDGLPELPNCQHDSQDGVAVPGSDDPSTHPLPPLPTHEVFLRQIERQARDDPIRRSAIHLAEVAYTDCCITDDVYDSIMLAMLDPEECSEKQIGNNQRFKTPALFRNWFENLCLEIWNHKKGMERKKQYLRVAAELGRLDLSRSKRQGVKQMGCSETNSDSKCPPSLNVASSLGPGATQEKPLIESRGEMRDERHTSKTRSTLNSETTSIEKSTGNSTPLASRTVPLPSLQGSKGSVEAAGIASLNLGPDGSLPASRTGLDQSTRLFVRPLPLNEGQVELVALFDGYQTESISRAIDTNGDLHHYGIVDFTTAAEAARAKANLHGKQVRNHRVSLSYRGAIGKNHDIVTVSGNPAASNMIRHGCGSNLQGNRANQAGEENGATVTGVISGKLKRSVSPALMGGADTSRPDSTSETPCLLKDNQAGDCDMIDNSKSDDLCTESHSRMSSELTTPHGLPLNATTMAAEVENGKLDGSGDIEMNINDETIDAMIAEYAQSERLQPPLASASGSFESIDADTKRLSSARETPGADTMGPTKLAYLSDTDLELQLRYEFAPNGKKSEVDLQSLVTCLICRGKGHMAAVCPDLTCHGCGAYKAHPARACPALRRCQRCRQQGHTKEACTSKLAHSAAADGLICDLCQQEGHLEANCSKNWRSFDPGTGPKAQVKLLNIYCYECGQQGHFGGDCLKRPPVENASGEPNLWTLEYTKQYIDISALNPSCLDRFFYGGKSRPEAGLSVKGRAQRNPIVLDSDSNDDSANFYRPKVLPQSASRGRIRIASSTLTSDHHGGSSWTPINPSFDERRPNQPRRDQIDHYRSSQPVGRDRQRSRSPELSSVRTVKDRYRPALRDDRIDRWQPPLPREPLPRKPLPREPLPKEPLPKRARVEDGLLYQGYLAGSSSRRGETYRPMPSAAKNARAKYLN